MVNWIGQKLGNYKLIRLLGSGGFGEVYLGENIHIGNQVAIKVLKGNFSPQDMQDFEKEARTIAALVHPHIVRLLDFGKHNGLFYMVMAYAANGTLEDRHSTGSPVPLATVVSYVKQIAEALQYAHDHKVVHRDIKPVNILIGQNNEILVGDFGIAIIAHRTQSMQLQVPLGTRAYAAPEQVKGFARPASDQYALGIMVCEWLTGMLPPFQPRMKLPLVSSAVEQVILKAVERDYKRRFPSIQEFAEALEQAYQPQTSTILPVLPTLPALPVAPTPQVLLPIPTVAFAHGTLLSTFRGHTKSVVSIAWSFDGRYIATKDVDQKMYIWEAAIGKPVSAYQRRPLSNVTTTQWSPRNQHIAIGKSDGTIQVWNVGAGTKVTNYRQRISTKHLTWSPDGEHIASDGDRVFYYGNNKSQPHHQPIHEVWVATTGERLFTCDHSDLYHVAWSPDGQHVALMSLYRMTNSVTIAAEVWGIGGRGRIFVYDSFASTSAFAWSPDGQHIAVASYDAVEVRSNLTGERIFQHEDEVRPINEQIRKELLKTIRDSRLVQYTETNLPDGMCTASGMGAVSWSPDGNRIAFAGGAETSIREGYFHRSLGIQVWDVKIGKQLHLYQGHSSVVRKIAWLPDMEHIISQGSEVNIWNVASGKTVFTYAGQGYKVLLSPDGNRVATASSNKTLQLWDARSGSHLFTFPGIAGGISDIVWSPDGTRIAIASGDGMVQVWQVT